MGSQELEKSLIWIILKKKKKKTHKHNGPYI